MGENAAEESAAFLFSGLFHHGVTESRSSVLLVLA